MRDFPGSPVAETLYSTAAGTSSIPDCGNWDPVSPEAQPKKRRLSGGLRNFLACSLNVFGDGTGCSGELTAAGIQVFIRNLL